MDGSVIVALLVAFIAAWALLIVVPLMRPRDIALADPSDVYKLCAARRAKELDTTR